jgi:hypothetical protein
VLLVDSLVAPIVLLVSALVLGEVIEVELVVLLG